MLRAMKPGDYELVYALWKSIKGFSMKSVDDSKEGVERFLKRNPNTSVIAIENGSLVGSILCGHDGRRGYFYHVSVRKDYQRRGIGTKMVVWCMEALKKEHISKISLIAFTNNDGGNAFWKKIGWVWRSDANFYDFALDPENIERFNS